MAILPVAVNLLEQRLNEKKTKPRGTKLIWHIFLINSTTVRVILSLFPRTSFHHCSSAGSACASEKKGQNTVFFRMLILPSNTALVFHLLFSTLIVE